MRKYPNILKLLEDLMRTYKQEQVKFRMIIYRSLLIKIALKTRIQLIYLYRLKNKETKWMKK